MIGPQNGAIKSQLGPLLNGIVNYEYWLPVPKMLFPGVQELIAEYQSSARGGTADPLGYYVVPQAYAQMQVVEQAIAGTSSLDDKKLAEFTRNNSFDTVVGQVRFGAGGGWAQPRVLQVQYQNIRSNEVDAFKNSNTQTVVWPEDLASGDLIYPFSKSRG